VTEKAETPALEIKVMMNSSCEDILAFKTCCGLKAFDQNLEVHVKNIGPAPVTVPSFFDLESDTGTTRVENLMPPGEHVIAPGEIKAFYCYMDEALWNASRTLVFYDSAGRRYMTETRQNP